MLPSKHMSKPSSTKFLPLYFTLTQKYTKLVLDQNNDLCSCCEAQSETSSHIFYQYSCSRQFWTDFESYWYFLSNQRVHLLLENVLYRVIMQQCSLLLKLLKGAVLSLTIIPLARVGYLTIRPVACKGCGRGP